MVLQGQLHSGTTCSQLAKLTYQRCLLRLDNLIERNSEIMRLQEDIGGNAESRSSSCLLPNWCHFSFCGVQVLLLILIWVDSDTFAVVVKGSSDICSDVRQFGVNILNIEWM